MHNAERRALRVMADHERAVRGEACRFLGTSGEALAACCQRLGGSLAEEAVWAWNALAISGSPAEWPITEALEALEAGIAVGDPDAARLAAPLRRIAKGARRCGVLAWLAEDPRLREDAEAEAA